MANKTPLNAVEKMEERVARLETAVFGSKSGHHQQTSSSGFNGATGGVRFLVSKNFFNAKRAFGDVRNALTKNDYHYSRQAVQTALKGLCARKGPLNMLKERGSNFYVNRK